MKFLLATLLGLLAINSAYGDWTFITRTAPPDGNDFYYEPSRIVRLGDIREVWLLLNAQTPKNGDKGIEKSSVLKLKFNCKREYYDITYSITYPELNGSGTPLKTSNFEGASFARMEPVPPNSTWDVIMKRICK